ncbi:hypothetical protein M0Q28_06365 [Patescibacteria group bacterium]|jgi:hypothetical protein|nr:hypothetical protein [Patescibacteria group bacterium]
MSAGIGASGPASADVNAPLTSASADIGLPRRLLEDDIDCCFYFSAPDDRDLPASCYSLQRHLTYDEIADEFVKWMRSSSRTAFLIGWPVTVDEVWDSLAVAFQRETYILIQSRNNFLEALGKQHGVKRQRNKHLRHGIGKTTVYRFMPAGGVTARTAMTQARNAA